jgi:transcriptional regulator with XRE-family HTH domain
MTTDAAALDAHCDAEDRETLGAEIRARREALGRTLRQTARALRRSPGWLSDVETARGGWSRLSPSTLDEIVGLLGVDAATHDRWHALAGHVEPGLLRALLDAPERWGDVRAMLAGGPRG